MLKEIKTIIWDWNGTLLNDLSISLESMNTLLKERNLPLLTTDLYQELFGFPVKDYYAQIGFDFEKEAFEIPANQFIDEFAKRLPNCGLHQYAEKALSTFEYLGLNQLILSAMEQEKLIQSVDDLGITPYFKKISGLSHNYATSKTDVGKAMLEELKVKPEETCLIGDTIHDYDVAMELGCKCLLIANGHQSERRLKATGADIYSSLESLLTEVRSFVLQNLNH